MRMLVLVPFVSCALAACFGDNGSGESPDAPSIQEIILPAEIDVDVPVDVTVRVRGRPAQQLSVAFDGTLGDVSPESRIVITDEQGAGEATGKYRALAAGAEELRVSVALLDGTGALESRSFPVYGVERLGQTGPMADPPATQASGVLIAYPFTFTAPQVVRKLGVYAPMQTPAGPVDAVLGLYATQNATSITALAKTSARLVAGANEIEIPSVPLSAGTYWFVIAYSGTPLVHRSATELVVVRYKTDFVYSSGLTDTISNLFTSAASLSDGLARYYARSLYLVVRK